MVMAALLNSLAMALFAAMPDAPRALSTSAPVEARVTVTHYEVTKETAGDEPVESVAVVALRRIASEHKTLYEREVVFASSGVRVLHTEEVVGEQRRLVWREFRPSGARTWVAEWGGDTAAKSTGYGWRRPVHEPLACTPEDRAPEIGPLELTFLLREGGVEEGAAIALVDPTAARTVDVVVRRASGVLEARRSDGSLIAGWTRVGASDVAEISEDRFARCRRRWLVPTRPAHDRIMSRIVWPELRRDLYRRPGSVRRL